MASLKRDRQGVLNINLIQGDDKTIYLKFEEKVSNVLSPIDLTLYSEIKMDVKKRIDINETPFITWTVGTGLTISGIDNNILELEFTQEFYESQLSQWYYDIKFVKDLKLSHMINGVINIHLVTTK